MKADVELRRPVCTVGKASKNATAKCRVPPVQRAARLPLVRTRAKGRMLSIAIAVPEATLRLLLATAMTIFSALNPSATHSLVPKRANHKRNIHAAKQTWSFRRLLHHTMQEVEKVRISITVDVAAAVTDEPYCYIVYLGDCGIVSFLQHIESFLQNDKQLSRAAVNGYSTLEPVDQALNVPSGASIDLVENQNTLFALVDVFFVTVSTFNSASVMSLMYTFGRVVY